MSNFAPQPKVREIAFGLTMAGTLALAACAAPEHAATASSSHPAATTTPSETGTTLRHIAAKKITEASKLRDFTILVDAAWNDGTARELLIEAYCDKVSDPKDQKQSDQNDLEIYSPDLQTATTIVNSPACTIDHVVTRTDAQRVIDGFASMYAN